MYKTWMEIFNCSGKTPIPCNGLFLFIGNGYIKTSSLKEILKELDDQLTERELDMMIEEIDTDGSGTVDFDGKPTRILICVYVAGQIPKITVYIYVYDSCMEAIMFASLFIIHTVGWCQRRHLFVL